MDGEYFNTQYQSLNKAPIKHIYLIERVILYAGLLGLVLLGSLLLPSCGNSADIDLTKPVEMQAVTDEPVEVLDGDTVYIDFDNTRLKLRLRDIDAPEKYQPYGAEATEFLRHILQDRPFYVTVPEPTKTSYKRKIGSITVIGNADVSEIMLFAGYAWWYEKYSDNIEYDLVETKARAQHKGLWEQETPLAPWLYRKGVDYKTLSRYYEYKPIRKRGWGSRVSSSSIRNLSAYSFRCLSQEKHLPVY